MQNLNFKDGYKLGANAVISANDEFCAVKHNSFGKWAEIIDSNDDLEYLQSRYTADLFNDDGILTDCVTSIFGKKPRYEVLKMSDILEI